MFAPVAAHLAGGAPLAEAGEPIEPDKLVELKMPEARAEDGQLVAHAVAFDRFGNVHARRRARRGRPARPAPRPPGVGERARTATTRRRSPTSPPARLLLYEDAYRWLALAVNRGSAADLLGLRLDDEVRIKPRAAE